MIIVTNLYPLFRNELQVLNEKSPLKIRHETKTIGKRKQKMLFGVQIVSPINSIFNEFNEFNDDV